MSACLLVLANVLQRAASTCVLILSLIAKLRNIWEECKRFMFLDFADVLVKLTCLRIFRKAPTKVESHLETLGV